MLGFGYASTTAVGVGALPHGLTSVVASIPVIIGPVQNMKTKPNNYEYKQANTQHQSG